MSNDASEANGCRIRNVDRSIDKDEFMVRIDLNRKMKQTSPSRSRMNGLVKIQVMQDLAMR